MPRALFLLVTLLCASLAHAEPAEEPRLPSLLTLDEALKIFRSRGFDLLIAEAAITNAEGDVKVAGAIPNPNYSVGGYRTFFGNNTSGGNSVPLFESQYGWYVGIGDSNAIEDTLSGKRSLRIDVAKKALEAARMGRADASRNLEFQVKQQYFQAVLALRALTFAREVQQRMTEYLDLTQKRFKAGAINEADEARTEIDKLEADQAVDVADQNLRAARVGLGFLLGLRSVVPEFQIEPDRINFAVPPPLAGATPDSLLREAYQHRPDLRGLTYQRERAEASVRLAKRNRFPDIGLNLQYSAQGSASGACFDASGNAVAPTNGACPGPMGTTTSPITPSSPPTVQFGISGTLPVLYQQQGEIVKSEADLRTQTLQRAKTEAQVSSDVQAAFNSFVSTQHLVQRMEARLLDRAQTALDKVLLQRAQGQASGLEVSAARRTLIATRVEYLQDLANYWIAISQLEQAVGMELAR